MALYRKLLVSLDTSSLAERALPYASTIARRKGSEVILFSVATSEMQAGQRLTSYLEDKAKELQAEGISASTAIAYKDAAQRITEFAENNQVDLIVMSSHGHTGVKRWILGSVAQKVVQSTCIPVLLVKSKSSEVTRIELKKILLSLDGSAFSEISIPYAEELAQGSDTEIILLQVVEPPPPVADAPPGWANGAPLNWADYSDKLIKQMRAQSTQYLEKVKADLQAKGIKIRTNIAVGKAADKVMDVARLEGVDLIIMGTHGRSGISRWVYGSVANRIMSESVQPVLLVRPCPPASP